MQLLQSLSTCLLLLLSAMLLLLLALIYLQRHL
jgi:hypothetical protein